MSWKVFLTACASTVLLSLPQNIFGCADGPDPHDYYTSFFSKQTAAAPEYYPFYYTALLDFYDDWYDARDTKNYDEDKVIQEWKAYCGVSTEAAAHFVYSVSGEDINSILSIVTKGAGPAIPDSVRKNAMTQCFLTNKKTEALQYLQFAKDVSEFCIPQDWDNPKKRDSLQLNGFINTADARYNKTTDPFLKDKYAFMRCKLAFHNNRFADCIRWYDAYFQPGNKSAVANLALGYKGGSLYNLGRNKEAAYCYMKQYAATKNDRKKIYQSFLWASQHANKDLVNEYVAVCKNDAEKADMYAMFALYGTDFRLAEIMNVYALNPSSSLLPLLAVREINKLEEQYVDPLVANNKNDKSLQVTESGIEKSSDRRHMEQTIAFFDKLGRSKMAQADLYATGAAYLQYMNRDFAKARTTAAFARTLQPSPPVADQLQLINLLVMASEQQKLDAAREKELLPLFQWLNKKALENEEYAIFYRNFFSEVLAKKYNRQGDDHRAALAYGVSENLHSEARDPGYYAAWGVGINYLRDKMNSSDLVRLFNLYETKSKTPYEQFLISNSAFRRNDLVDVIGTSYLRDFDFAKAAEWLRKTEAPQPLVEEYYQDNKTVVIRVDPFYDYLNDWQRFDKQAPSAYTKRSLAEKMIQKHKSLDTARSAASKSKIYYELASAYYNLSYYGNAWSAVTWYRGGSDWYEGNYSTQWEKEYYGVFTARNYYQKAYELATDKEFKAAAYFMVAKCVQRQIPRVSWYADEASFLAYEKRFRDNKMFPGFIKEFGNTKFYKYTYNRCSYLRDFIAQHK
jgi:hypothetical protein